MTTLKPCPFCGGRPLETATIDPLTGVIPYTSDDKQNYFAEVIWLDNCPAFGLYTFKAPKFLVRGISEGCELIEDDLSDFEIIGNIYDNPELIGGDE